MISKIEYCKSQLEKLEWLAQLLTRLSVGVIFAESGWGKLQNLEKVVEYFTSLGIPFPTVQAPFVAGLEFVAGLMLIAGIVTRLASLPLMAVMGVAILTAKREEISTLTDIFGFSEYLYIILLIWIFVSGPGAISLDHIISKKLKGKS